MNLVCGRLVETLKDLGGLLASCVEIVVLSMSFSSAATLVCSKNESPASALGPFPRAVA